ncbi:L,D-transpeptidase [Hoeflea alexandrii]|uniref:L,D-transpeptidase n=1 Tax=Hoeflea alexandrii TaxID=288436 RepID=UPI003CCCDB7D
MTTRVSRRFMLTVGASALMVAPFAQGAAAFPRLAAPASVEAGSDDGFPLVEVSTSKKPKPEFMRKKVRLVTSEKPGTIIIDTSTKYLYYVEGNNRATRYGVGVGREGFGWSGTVKVGRKAEWPDWRPPSNHDRAGAQEGPDHPDLHEGWAQQSTRGPRALSLQGRPRHHLPHPWHQPALDHRPEHVVGLHPDDEQGCRASLQAGRRWLQGHRHRPQRQGCRKALYRSRHGSSGNPLRRRLTARNCPWQGRKYRTRRFNSAAFSLGGQRFRLTATG